MKVLIGPNNAGFIDRGLYFNLTNHRYSNQNPFNGEKISIAFIWDKYLLGINLENKLFYVRDREKNAVYGPYKNIEDAISRHLFAKIDGLFYFYRHYIRLNKELNVYEINWPDVDFVYHPYMDEFNFSFKKIADAFKKMFKIVKVPFRYSFVSTADYGEGVISKFLVKLANIFKNIPENKKEDGLSIFIRIHQSKQIGLVGKDYGFLVFNNYDKREAVFYIPKIIYKDYFNIVNNTKEEIFKKVFTDKKIVLDNKKQMELIKTFDIDVNETKDVLFEVDMLLYLKAVLVKDTPMNIVYLLDIDGVPYYIEANLQNRTFTMNDFEPMQVYNFNIKYDNGFIITKTDTDNAEDFNFENYNNKYKVDWKYSLIENIQTKFKSDFSFAEFI